eukprot:m.321897 g.321897  ORF g.321897 m.321897 type:complete len:213 (+) comp16002_c0_seq39:142-780(+)
MEQAKDTTTSATATTTLRLPQDLEAAIPKILRSSKGRGLSLQTLVRNVKVEVPAVIHKLKYRQLRSWMSETLDALVEAGSIELRCNMYHTCDKESKKLKRHIADLTLHALVQNFGFSKRLSQARVLGVCVKTLDIEGVLAAFPGVTDLEWIDYVEKMVQVLTTRGYPFTSCKQFKLVHATAVFSKTHCHSCVVHNLQQCTSRCNHITATLAS